MKYNNIFRFLDKVQHLLEKERVVLCFLEV